MTKLCPVLGKFMREVDVKVFIYIDVYKLAFVTTRNHFLHTLIMQFNLHMLSQFMFNFH